MSIMVDGWEHGCRHYLNVLMPFAVQFALGRFSFRVGPDNLVAQFKTVPDHSTIAAEIFLPTTQEGSVAKVRAANRVPVGGLSALETLCLRSLQHWLLA